MFGEVVDAVRNMMKGCEMGNCDEREREISSSVYRLMFCGAEILHHTLVA